MPAELSRAQLDDLKRRFDGECYLASGPARRTHLPLRAFGRANHAQPNPSGRERLRVLCGETAALFGFIENVKASAVEDKTERTGFRGTGQKVQGGEAARQSAAIQLRGGSFRRARGDVNAQDVEAELREPNGIRPVPAPISSARAGRTRPKVTNSTTSGSGSPVSRCPPKA